MRYFKAIVEYDGTEFAGFQWQHETRTVQGELERAILVRTGQTLRLSGAGRTDAGVHALGQVVSFGVETRIPLDRMALALNKTLPPDVTIRSVTEVEPAFDARGSRLRPGVYSYLILNRRTPFGCYGGVTARSVWNRSPWIVCEQRPECSSGSRISGRSPTSTILRRPRCAM